MAPWGAQDLIDLVAVPKTVASEKIVTCGGYPGAVPFWNDRERWNRYLRDAIIEPAIGRDLLQLEQVRRPALRKQVFALAAAHPAEILSLEKIAGSLAEKGTLETSAHFLEVLQPTLLVATLKNHVGDEIRRRRAPPKRVVLNNPFWPAAVRPRLRRLSPVRRNGGGGWRTRAPLLSSTAGRSSTIGARSRGKWTGWARVHGVNGWRRCKSGPFGHSDLGGLAQVARKIPAFKPIVLGDPGCEDIAQAAGFTARSWPAFLLTGLADRPSRRARDRSSRVRASPTPRFANSASFARTFSAVLSRSYSATLTSMLFFNRPDGVSSERPSVVLTKRQPCRARNERNGAHSSVLRSIRSNLKIKTTFTSPASI